MTDAPVVGDEDEDDAPMDTFQTAPIYLDGTGTVL